MDATTRPSESTNIKISTTVNDTATLVWQDLTISSQTQNSGTTIVHNVSGSLLPGSLVALMGPSGAGKSTLMAALAHRSSADITTIGEIRLNGIRTGSFMYNISGFIYQDELFCGALTVGEHMHLMASLKLGPTLPTFNKNRLINDLLTQTNLLECYHTQIGGDGERKTISGGEKKRLAFAVELLSRPKILFCDEPTTGLDSYSAGQVVQMMRGLTRSGTSVLCTIHQPSDELFYMFDNVLLLTNGRTAFMGKPHEAIGFFDLLNIKRPFNCATAEFLIDCLSTRRNISDRIKPDEICDQYEKSDIYYKQKLIISSKTVLSNYANINALGQNELILKRNWFYTLNCLIKRNFLHAHRNPQLQYMKLAQRIVIAVLVGLCFSDTIDLSQVGAQAVQGIIFLIVSENTFLPMYAVLSVFPDSFPLFLRERKANLYGTGQFYIAQIIAMMPFVLLESTLFILIVYFLAHLRPTMLGLMCTVSVSVLVMNVSMACGCFFSTMFSSVPMAMSYLVPFDYVLMITSGIFIRIWTISKALRWLPFISWMMFASEAISIAQWDGIEYLDCEDIPDKACLHDGDDVLQQYSFGSSHLALDFIALIAQYFLYHGLALLFLQRRASKS
ncbi:protein scarlet-like [Armigeres subalbatus]|uniref:protein scarlet-like n=1 Tax=Armigeres subalbatus TaxID=124917 RepID=UPI002ED21FBD